MSRRVLGPLLVLFSLGVVAVTVFGASSGIASRRDDIPTLERKLADCRQDVAYDREAISVSEKFVTLAKRNQLLVIGHVEGFPIFATVSQYRDDLILSYVTGKITKAQLAAKLAGIAPRVKTTFNALNAILQDAKDELDSDQARCAQLAEQLRKAKSGGSGGGGGGTTFTLQTSQTQVDNTHKGELTIDPAGHEAHFKASSGAIWESDYEWKVPDTITPGQSFEIMLHDHILGVHPDQPIGDQMVARAPGFAQAIQAHWPDTPDTSKTFTVPIAADQKASTEIVIEIELQSSIVRYHYTK